MREALQALAPLLHAAIPEMDRLRRLPDAVADAFCELGLWKLWVPRELGGSELPLPEALRLFEDASRIDGSIGWSLAIGVGGGLFAAYLPPGTAEEIFRPANALIAGSGAPHGVRRAVGGGYRVSGTWRYASGIHHATWVTANTVPEDPAERFGHDDVLAVAVPAREVQVRDTWRTFAMRGTDSHDISMDGVAVDSDHTFRLSEAPRIERPLYLFPFLEIAAASFAAVSLGISFAALDAFSNLATARPASETGQRDAQSREARYARADGAIRAARVYLHEAAEAAWQEQMQSGQVSEAQRSNLNLAAIHATRATDDALGGLMEAAGMAALYEDHPLGRCCRDLRGAHQHALISTMRESEIGSALLRTLR